MLTRDGCGTKGLRRVIGGENKETRRAEAGAVVAGAPRGIRGALSSVGRDMQLYRMLHGHPATGARVQLPYARRLPHRHQSRHRQ